MVAQQAPPPPSLRQPPPPPPHQLLSCREVHVHAAPAVVAQQAPPPSLRQLRQPPPPPPPHQLLSCREVHVHAAPAVVAQQAPPPSLRQLPPPHRQLFCHAEYGKRLPSAAFLHEHAGTVLQAPPQPLPPQPRELCAVVAPPPPPPPPQQQQQLPPPPQRVFVARRSEPLGGSHFDSPKWTPFHVPCSPSHEPRAAMRAQPPFP